jgi:hypothetical protein
MGDSVAALELVPGGTRPQVLARSAFGRGAEHHTRDSLGDAPRSFGHHTPIRLWMKRSTVLNAVGS